MGKRADIAIGGVVGGQFNGGGINYLIQTPTGVLYCIYINSGTDVVFKKSSDNGLSWTADVAVFTGTATALSVWYDRWSNISAGLIHCAYSESVTDDTLYRTINTESADALSTQTSIFAGASTATGGWLSITRSRGGNVYCNTVIDAGAEGGFFRLLNANVPNGAWDAARANPEALATTDQIILVPGFAADTQDIMAIFWDASANQISRYIHDDSANTWAETIFTGTFTDLVATTNFPHFAAAVDITNSQILVVAWNALDTLNADLTCWTVTESAITAKTDVVANSTDDQGFAGICLDTLTSIWWVFYGGKSNGSETFATSINIYCKGSFDSGSTWGPETLLTTRLRSTLQIFTIPRLLFTVPLPPPVVWYCDGVIDDLIINLSFVQPHATSAVGI